MLLMKSLFGTAGCYYLAKTIWFTDKIVGKNFKFIKPNLANAEDDFPSSKLDTGSLEREVGNGFWDHNWDYMNTCRAPRRNVYRHLVFIRHGDYHKSGKNFGSLTPKGVEQIKNTAQKIKERYQQGNQRIRKAYFSTVKRARQSSNILRNVVRNTTYESSDLIVEGYPCVPDPEVGKVYPEHVIFRDSAQFEAGFRRIFYRPEHSQDKNITELYICHSNLIRYFIMRGLQLPEKAWIRLSPDNGSITEFRIFPDGQVKVLSIGENTHNQICLGIPEENADKKKTDVAMQQGDKKTKNEESLRKIIQRLLPEDAQNDENIQKIVQLIPDTTEDEGVIAGMIRKLFPTEEQDDEIAKLIEELDSSKAHDDDDDEGEDQDAAKIIQQFISKTAEPRE